MNDGSNKKVIFVTYNSLDVIVSAVTSYEKFKFSLAIFDESHRTAGKKESKMFTYGLYDDYIKIEKRLFMTATERLVSPRIRKKAEEFGDIIFSMDDESLYGPVLASINFGEAIEQNIISDYEIILVTIDEVQYDEFKNAQVHSYVEIGDENKNVDKDVLLKQLVLNKAIKDLNIKKAITYHSYVKNAKSFVYGNDLIYPLSKILEGVSSTNSDYYLEHVNGTMNTSTRQRILKEFEDSKIGVVSNAKCLTEGVDVPAIDAIYFADPKNSLVDIVQAVGRSLRKSKDKENEYSYVILPIILPKDASMFSELDNSEFETLHNIVQAMRMQDNRLADEIDALNMYKATGGYGKKPSGNLKIRLMPYSQLSISDFEEGLSLRIAQINKDVIGDEKEINNWTEKYARKSNLKRVFKSIGDYNWEAYRDSLVIPTLEKFINGSKIYSERSSSEIKVNNNNISHTRRYGAIIKDGKNYRLTPLGEDLISSNFNNFYDYAKRQLLYYNSENIENNEFLFPYRAILKIIKETLTLSRLEFLYCIYPLRSTSDIDINISIDNVFYIRETYPNIEALCGRIVVVR
ncbi:hypothetical protein E9840_12285 [Tissierella creatinini]|nr:hypothetical protein E9840_12285 [Tissierella creatinini]TJX58980.1 hypothetical protein E8P77_21655 [Soehngenia saccharolytica]